MSLTRQGEAETNNSVTLQKQTNERKLSGQIMKSDLYRGI